MNTKTHHNIFKRFYKWIQTKFSSRSNKKCSSLDDSEEVHLFDLAALYLEEHGYYARVSHNKKFMIVFSNWFKYKMYDRSGEILRFEIGWNYFVAAPSDIRKRESVWCYTHATQETSFWGEPYTFWGKPTAVGNICDPFCIDHILTKVKEYYDGFQ